MRQLLVVFLVVAVACEGERGERGAAAPIDHGQSKRSIDVTVTNAPISIRGVELVPGRRLGELELGYRVDARGPAVVPARIMCRVAERNLVYPVSAAGKVAGPRLTSLFRAHPFKEAPRACEVAFMFREREHGDERTVAYACYEAGALRDGRCAPATFPPPVLSRRGSVAIEQAALELHDNTAVVTGLYSLIEALPDQRRFAGTIACEDPAGTVSGEGDLAFLPLDDIPVGASVYGPLTIFLDRTPAASSRCELRVVSRAIVGAPAEVRHAELCLTTRSVQAGPC